MAVNQVSLFFYLPGWQQQLTPAHGLLTDEGTTVQLASPVRTAGAEGEPLAADAIKDWLRENGFTPVEWGGGRVFERGQVRSIFGMEQDIIIHVNDEGGEAASLYCRYTLPGRSPPPISDWATLTSSLCDRFGLRLGAEGTGPCSVQEFVAAVLANRNYQDFAASRGWAETNK